jgi:hypothetical protein
MRPARLAHKSDSQSISAAQNFLPFSVSHSYISVAEIAAIPEMPKMEKRFRSPNYPAISLPEAIERCGAIYERQKTHAAPREVVVRSMGFAGINGASATAYSALLKYGLLDKQGEDARLSELAMSILHPHSQEEKAHALKQAANGPPLFQDLAERFPSPLPAEEVIRNYLIRKNFAPHAVQVVILAYRETMDLVEREAGSYDSASLSPDTGLIMQPQALPSPKLPPSVIAGQPVEIQYGSASSERPLARYDFEGGAYVRIVMSGDIETEDALNMLDKLISLKREEIKAPKSRAPAPIELPRIETPNGEPNA